MTKKDFADIIRLVRRAPLTNMDEAEAVNALLSRFGEFAQAHLDQQADQSADIIPIDDIPDNPGGTS